MIYSSTIDLYFFRFNSKKMIDKSVSKTLAQELLEIGSDLEDRGERDRAIVYYTEAIALDLDSPKCYARRGFTRYHCEDYTGAKTDFDRRSNSSRTHQLPYIIGEKPKRN
jgi:tetratricopeptide (TPR) repeat protein